MPANSPEQLYVHTASGTVEVLRQGAGPLLVMLPSAARGQEDFDDLAARLAARGWRVLRPEPRGIGGTSPGRAGPVTLHDLAADIAAVIRSEAAGPAVVLGHAFGGFVARTLAVDHPELVRGLIIVASGAASTPPAAAAMVSKAADTSLPPQDRLAALQAGFFAPGHDATPWLQGWYPRARAIQQAASRSTPREAYWTGGEAPILEIQGGDDPFRGEAPSDELSSLCAPGRVDVHVIANASHALVPEQPEELETVVHRWLERLVT